jgi:hypothetical protein
MAHIRYGDRNYTIPNSGVDEVRNRIQQALESGDVATLSINESVDGMEYPSTLFVSKGVPVSVHEWDTEQL